MDSIAYQELSLRTVPEPLQYWKLDYEGDVEKTRASLITNCALGMAGEAAEIDELTLSDEIGDGYWYAYICLWTLNVEGYDPQPQSVIEPQLEAYRASGKVAEFVKKHAFHGRPFEDVLEPCVRSTKRYIDALAALDSQTVEATFDQNITKLKSRYPEGFFERG